MTPKHARFAKEYPIDLNGAAAAVRAGYSAKSAKRIAFDLLRRPDVDAAIRATMAERAAKVEITAERVLRELALLGFANMADYMRTTADGDPVLDLSALTRDQAAALQEVTVEDFTDGRGENARDVKRIRFKLADKRAALVDLGRHLKLFTDTHEVTGRDGAPLMPTPPITVPEELLREVLARRLDEV